MAGQYAKTMGLYVAAMDIHTLTLQLAKISGAEIVRDASTLDANF